MVQVAIEHLLLEDCAQVATWLSDPENNQWLYSEWRGRPIDERLVAVVRMNPRNLLWSILVNRRAVGVVALAQIDNTDRMATLWYVLGDKAARNQGVATRAVTLAAIEAFRSYGLHCLTASVMRPNVASSRVLEKAGFRLAGQFREAMMLHGKAVDRVLYDMVPTDLT